MMVFVSKNPHMNTSTLTSGGRLTVPKEIRVRLNLKPGDKFSFEVGSGDSVRLRVQRRKTLGGPKGSLSSERAYPGKEAERESAREHVSRKVSEKSSP